MPMKDGMPIPYEDGGAAFDAEVTAEGDEKVIYAKRSEAQERAKKTDGTVIQIGPGNTKDDGTEVKAGYKVIPKIYANEEGSTSGFTTVYGAEGPGSVGFEGDSTPTRNMGGMVEDELGYMGGGVSYGERGPIKYSKGGAVSGKNFKGSF
jgi:co-chaperonin GroES (HSP10)